MYNVPEEKFLCYNCLDALFHDKANMTCLFEFNHSLPNGDQALIPLDSKEDSGMGNMVPLKSSDANSEGKEVPPNKSVGSAQGSPGENVSHNVDTSINESHNTIVGIPVFHSVISSQFSLFICHSLHFQAPFFYSNPLSSPILNHNLALVFSLFKLCSGVRIKSIGPVITFICRS